MGDPDRMIRERARQRAEQAERDRIEAEQQRASEERQFREALETEPLALARLLTSRDDFGWCEVEVTVPQYNRRGKVTGSETKLRAGAYLGSYKTLASSYQTDVHRLYLLTDGRVMEATHKEITESSRTSYTRYTPAPRAACWALAGPARSTAYRTGGLTRQRNVSGAPTRACAGSVRGSKARPPHPTIESFTDPGRSEGRRALWLAAPVSGFSTCAKRSTASRPSLPRAYSPKRLRAAVRSFRARS